MAKKNRYELQSEFPYISKNGGIEAAKDLGSGFLTSILTVPVISSVPTSLRILKQYVPEGIFDGISQHIKEKPLMGLGAAGGGLTMSYVALQPTLNYAYENPYLFFAPIVTNTLSGIYEGYRTLSGKNLESKIE